MAEYRTKTGRVLTDADIERLADEAEADFKPKGWSCVRCGTYSRTRFGRWLHTHFAWDWRKGNGLSCTRFLWWGSR